jgi:mRNA-degrading endonuclease toxin of MazEF toxin-antitoxin module
VVAATGQLTPMRGEVWVCAVPIAGPHPVVVLTVNRIAEPLAALTVAIRSDRPPRTCVSGRRRVSRNMTNHM